MTSSGGQVQDLIRASFLDGEWCQLGEPDDERASRKDRLIRRDPAETPETVAALGVFARHEPVVDEAEAVAQAWREDETIPGKFLTDLLLSAKDHRWHRARLRLRGARIVGAFDLNGLSVDEQEIELSECWFDEVPDLGDARLRYLHLDTCRLPGLSAWHAFVRNTVRLTGCVVTGTANLRGAHIQGDLDLSESSWHASPPGEPDADTPPAFYGDDLHVGRTMDCVGMRVHGELRLERARVDGALTLREARLSSPGGRAFVGVGMRIRGGLFLAGAVQQQEAHNLPSDSGGPALPGAWVDGGIVLDGSEIGGELQVFGLRDLGKLSLSAVRIKVGQDVLIDADTKINGLVDLTSAQVGGNVRVVSSELYGGIWLDGLRVDGSLDIRDSSFRTDPEHNPAASTSGPSTDAEADTYAIDANLMAVKHLVSFSNVDVVGGLSLGACTVDGGIAIQGVSFRGSPPAAILLDSTRVGQALNIVEVECDGALSANDVKVGGVCTITGTYHGRQGEDSAEMPAISAIAIDVATILGIGAHCTGHIDIQSSRATESVDLDGCRFERLPGRALAVRATSLATRRLRVTDTSVDGQVLIDGAVIPDEIDLSGLSFRPAQATGATAEGRRAGGGEAPTIPDSRLDGQRLRTGTLRLPTEPWDDTIDLSGATVSTLDDAGNPWQRGRYRLVGLTYAELASDARAVRRRGFFLRLLRALSLRGARWPRILDDRLRWLGEMEAYHAQPYRQLAAYYRDTGRDGWAKLVLWRSHHLRARRSGSLRRFFSSFYNALSGYGYLPGRAARWFLAAIAGAVAYVWFVAPAPIRDPLPAVIASIDLVAPTSPFGVEADLRGTDAPALGIWFGLQILGWLLSLSIFPTLARGLSSDSPNRL